MSLEMERWSTLYENRLNLIFNLFCLPGVARFDTENETIIAANASLSMRS